MTEFFWIYLYTTLSSISTMADVILVLLIICLAILAFIYAITFNDSEGECLRGNVNSFTKNHGTTAMRWVVVLILFSSLVPDDDDIKTIIGGGLAWKATQIEGVSELPENMVRVMNQFLENTAEDLK